jgi:hypothetical protein
MKDLFKASGFKYLGPYGLKCPCCDSKLSHKRKTKINRNAFNQLKRANLKRILLEEIKE